MPDIGNWRQQIKGGLGPLLRIIGAMDECLVVLIKENGIGTVLPGTASIQAQATGKCLQIQYGSIILRLVIKTSRRGVRTSERIEFDEPSADWVYDQQRTDAELVDVQNAIRAAIGIPPWDPVREPWGIDR